MSLIHQFPPVPFLNNCMPTCRHAVIIKECDCCQNRHTQSSWSSRELAHLKISCHSDLAWFMWLGSGSFLTEGWTRWVIRHVWMWWLFFQAKQGAMSCCGGYSFFLTGVQCLALFLHRVSLPMLGSARIGLVLTVFVWMLLYYVKPCFSTGLSSTGSSFSQGPPFKVPSEVTGYFIKITSSPVTSKLRGQMWGDKLVRGSQILHHYW